MEKTKYPTPNRGDRRTQPDYKNSLTPQERHMENVERGYTLSYSTAAAAVRYEMIDGKRYKVVTL